MFPNVLSGYSATLFMVIHVLGRKGKCKVCPNTSQTGNSSRLLIVDDDAYLRTSLRQQLVAKGFTIFLILDR